MSQALGLIIFGEYFALTLHALERIGLNRRQGPQGLCIFKYYVHSKKRKPNLQATVIKLDLYFVK